MNEEYKEDLKDFFKNTKEIKGMVVPTDFKDMFKNVSEIKELPPVPENLDTTHLQEFIDELEGSDNKMNYEDIEELAFKDRKVLANLNEMDLLNIIEFLQIDRKQWINQYTKAHNDYVDLQQENRQLKKVINNFHYCPYDDKCGELYDCSKEEYQGMIESNMKLSLQLDLYKSVLDEIREYINSNPNVFYDEYLIDVETLKNNECVDETVGEIKFISNLLLILDKAKESE